MPQLAAPATWRLISGVSAGYRRPLSLWHRPMLPRHCTRYGSAVAVSGWGNVCRRRPAHILTRAHTLIILSPPVHPPPPSHHPHLRQAVDIALLHVNLFTHCFQWAAVGWWQPLEGFCLNCDGDRALPLVGGCGCSCRAPTHLSSTRQQSFFYLAHFYLSWGL